MKKFVFDFDGVICDSTPECYVTSNNAWNTMHKIKKTTSFKNLNDNLIYNKFLKFRPYVKGGGEYYIFYYMEKNKIKKTYDNYKRYKNKFSNEINNYSKFFYKERAKLKKNNLNTWLKLNYVFPDVLKILKYLHSNNQLLISTMKDKQSIIQILKNKKIKMSKKLILDQFDVKNKLESLKLFMNRFNIEKKDIYFFDDNVNHILQPKRQGFSVYLTTWGYSTKEFMQIAKKNKISVLNNIKKFNFK